MKHVPVEAAVHRLGRAPALAEREPEAAREDRPAGVVAHVPRGDLAVELDPHAQHRAARLDPACEDALLALLEAVEPHPAAEQSIGECRIAGELEREALRRGAVEDRDLPRAPAARRDEDDHAAVGERDHPLDAELALDPDLAQRARGAANAVGPRAVLERGGLRAIAILAAPADHERAVAAGDDEARPGEAERRLQRERRRELVHHRGAVALAAEKAIPLADAQRVAAGEALGVGVLGRGDHRAVAERDPHEGAAARDDRRGEAVGKATLDRSAERLLPERPRLPRRHLVLVEDHVEPGLARGVGPEGHRAARVDEVAPSRHGDRRIPGDDIDRERPLRDPHRAPGRAGVEGGKGPAQIGVDDGAPPVGKGESPVSGGGRQRAQPARLAGAGVDRGEPPVALVANIEPIEAGDDRVHDRAELDQRLELGEPVRGPPDLRADAGVGVKDIPAAEPRRQRHGAHRSAREQLHGALDRPVVARDHPHAIEEHAPLPALVRDDAALPGEVREQA